MKYIILKITLFDILDITEIIELFSNLSHKIFKFSQLCQMFTVAGYINRQGQKEQKSLSFVKLLKKKTHNA